MKLKKLLIFSLLGLPLAISAISCSASSISAIRLLCATENNDVFIGDFVNVETRRLEYQGEYQDVFGVIVNPDGDTYQGKSFTVSEAGLYQVVYRAYFGHHREEQVVNYLCKRKSSDFFTITNPVDISYGEYRHDFANYHNEGVIIDMKSGTEILFNTPLSIDDFMNDQVQTRPGKGYKDRSYGMGANPLIDFLIDPSEAMSADFSTLTIRLTDSIDKTNYVDIHIEDAYLGAYSDSWTMSNVRIGASCNWQMGWEWDGTADGNPSVSNVGKFHNGIGGTGLNLSFRASHHANMINSAKILYCAANSRFYNCLGSLESTTSFSYFVNDLSDPIVYGNSAWEGFKSGKFYLSIIPTSFSNATARLLIKSVGRYSFPSEVLADEVAPTISVDTLGYEDKYLPHAVVGKSYPIFNATVSDNYDSDLNCHTSVTYRDSINKKDIDVSVVNNTFKANKSGFYTIKYEARDKSGNAADVITKRIITSDTVDDVVLSLPTSEKTVSAFENVTIPNINDVESVGGVENSRIAIKRRVIDPRGKELIIEGDEFRPSLVGNYQVIFTGADYVGNTGEVTYTIHSQELSNPVFVTEPNLPPALINGFKYSFDNISAIETKDGEVVYVIPEILVNGEPYTGSYTASGTTATITYKAVGESSYSTYDVNLSVIDVTSDEGGLHHSKYFVGDYTAVESIYRESNNVTLSGLAEGYSTFINALNPNLFYLGLRLIDGQTNMRTASVKLTDSNNQNIHVTFDIDLVNKKIKAPYLPELDFSFSEDSIGLEYNDEIKAFYDTNQNKLGTLLRDDNGNVFNGFTGGVYLSVGFKDVSSQSSLAIEKICNQPIGYRSKGKDRIQPTIRYNSPLVSEQQKGREFNYPTFEAFDVLSDISETSIKVTKPNGTSISGDKDMTETFTIVETGDYNITYIAKDTANNTKKIIELISVYDDLAPTISVKNPPGTIYSLNSAFKIPEYTANDESGKYTVDVILILPTNEMRILTHHVHDEEAEEVDVIEYALDPEKEIYNESFIINKTTCRLQQVGTYRLRYVVYDTAYNTTTLEYSFVVK